MQTWVAEAARRAGFSQAEREILAVSLVELDAKGRRSYRRMRARMPELARCLQEEISRRGRHRPQFLEEELATQLAVKAVANGHVSLVDGVLIDAVGRGRVARIVEALKGGGKGTGTEDGGSRAGRAR